MIFLALKNQKNDIANQLASAKNKYIILLEHYSDVWDEDAVKPFLSEEERLQLIEISERLPDYSQKRSVNDKKTVAIAGYMFTSCIGLRKSVEAQFKEFKDYMNKMGG